MAQALPYLVAAYFHEDFRDDYLTAVGSVRAFVEDEPPRLAAELRAAIAELFSTERDEDKWRQLWIGLGGHNYEPGDDGMTYTQWFERIRGILSEQ